jgi:polar amino acid transport system substrate-binding protein
MKTKGIIVFVLAALIAVSAFAGGAKESGGLTVAPGVLRVGMEIGYPPMEYMGEDGFTPMGFDVEMMKAVAAKLGLKVEFIDTAWDGIFAGVDKGDYDCIASAVTITEARINAHNFSKPYIVNNLAVVVPKGSGIAISSPADLAGHSVSYQAETTSDFYLADYAAEHGLTFETYEYDKVMQCFDEMRLGRVDTIVTDKLVAVDYVPKAEYNCEIVYEVADLGEAFGICMKKGNDALTAAIDKALDDLFADGTMKKLSQDIFGMDMVSAAR